MPIEDFKNWTLKEMVLLPVKAINADLLPMFETLQKRGMLKEGDEELRLKIKVIQQQILILRKRKRIKQIEWQVIIGTYILAKLKQIKTKQSSNYEKKLPKWTCFLDEEWQAFLLDERKKWYADKPLKWRTHLSVSRKTLQFVVMEVFCKQFKRRIEQRFQPLYRRRLF